MSSPYSSESHALPTVVRRVATHFRLVGWISFWLQLVLAVVSGGIILLAISNPTFNLNRSSSSSGLGLLLGVAGLIALAVSTFWSFRYTRFAQRLQADNPNLRPTKGRAIQHLRVGLLINIIGMVLTLIGAEWIVGVLLVKTLSIPQGAAIYNTNRLIEPLDIFVVQASINTVLAQFSGILAALWLLQRVNQP